MIRNAIDLTPAERAALEVLLGRRVQDAEAVSLRTFEQPRISPQERKEITAKLRQYFAEVDTKRAPVSDRERDDAIDEAMRSVRPSYRTHP